MKAEKLGHCARGGDGGRISEGEAGMGRELGDVAAAKPGGDCPVGPELVSGPGCAAEVRHKSPWGPSRSSSSM